MERMSPGTCDVRREMGWTRRPIWHTTCHLFGREHPVRKSMRAADFRRFRASPIVRSVPLPDSPARTPLRVAALQIQIADGEPERNLGSALAAAEVALASEARLLLLPELWTTGYAHDRWARTADELTPGIIEKLGRFCARHGIHLGGSMIDRNADGGLVNRFRMIGPSGETVASYDKSHLFPPMQEDRFLTAGRARGRFDLTGWSASPSICYDLRFPEMYRHDAVAGADLFLVPSEWPLERAAIMRGLAWARAVENQAFLVLCNRTGTAADGTAFAGGSMIVAPDGTVLAEADSEPQVLVALLDPAILTLRHRLPVLTGRVNGVDF